MPGTLKQVRGAGKDGKMQTVQQFQPQLYQYTNEGIEIVIDKVTHAFITDDPQFNKQYIGKRFSVRFDQEKLDKIYLFENTAEGARPFIFNGTHTVLQAQHLFAQALVDRQEGEAKKLSAHLNKKKIQQASAEETAQRFIGITKAGRHLHEAHA